MFEKEAEEYADENDICVCDEEYWSHNDIKQAYQKGAEFGYNKANEWHKVSDKLPEINVLVYIWNNVDDFPIIARRHIPYGQKEWVWDCKWGSGYTVSQLAG